MQAEHVDVLIVGAGLSGIGAACHLQERCPGKTFAILEAREDVGGTWDLFRYPGVRSDSDMFTLGYCFRPWDNAKAIADGPSILRYVHDTARDYGVEDRIHFNHKVLRAQWSSENARWAVEAERGDTGETVTFTCGFLYMCTGYYSYDEGYTPQFAGAERFAGQIIHPQHWPEDLDYTGKRVAVIGSGATAVTLVPAMADKAAHVTMVQRSPTYVVTLPGTDGLAEALQKRVSPKLAYALVRWKNVLLMMGSYKLSRRAPKLMRNLIRKAAANRLPEGYAIDTSRTKALGRSTDAQRRAYQTVLTIFDEVLKAARPGVPAVDLVTLAVDVAREHGYDFWGPFLGHGAGLDLHERPDLVREATPLAANMVLAVEPRLALGDHYLLGVEDMVVVTESGGVSLNGFEKEPFEIGDA